MADKRDVRSALRAYEQPSMLQGAWDEISGAFARYGRRSGAQRDASLAMLNQAVDPNTDPLTGAGMKALGLAGLVTHPLAFFPTREEWDERLSNAGNTGRMGQAIGGMLGDLPGLIDPQLLAGGGVLAAAPLVGKLARQGKTLSHSELLARGADGHLSSAREMQIPVSKVVGREPTPAAAEGMPYVKGRPITQPIEVEYNAADDTYTLYAGNHRITQAELNGDEFIPAFVQGNGGKFGGSPSAVSREQALESMVDQPQRRQITTQSYKETLPDGTERWVPGTLRSNPTTAPLLGKIANKAGDFNEGRVAYRGLTRPYDPSAKGYYQSFTSSADDAREYGENVMAAHLRLGNNLPVSAGGNNFNAIPLDSLPEDLAAKVRQRHGGNTATTDEIAHAARESGYDSVTFQNVHDSKWGERGKTGEARTIDMVFDNNNIRPLQDFKFEQPAQKKIKLSAEEDALLSELFK